MIRGSQPQSRESSLKLYHKSESPEGARRSIRLALDVHRPRNRGGRWRHRARVAQYEFSFSCVIENIAALVISGDHG